ncbi:MAG: hypothetical protein IT373_30875 [Polyangiaceae bacterium]|nr:hypothetical protein [Polyangiaceae bacterium]
MPRNTKPQPVAGQPKAQPKTKSDFILAHPVGTRAKDIVAAGKATGMSFDEKYVYTIRSVDRARKQQQAARAAFGAAAPAGSAAEQLLFAVAAEVGLARAIELLDTRRRSVMAALGRER